MNNLRRTNILGYPVLNEAATRVATTVCDGINGDRSKSFVFLNPHSVVVASQESNFRDAIVSAYGIFCDGVGLELAGLLLTRRRVTRVYGYEFFLALSQQLSDRGLGRVFFLGGSDSSLEKLTYQYRTQFPGIQDIQAYAPPYQIEFSTGEIASMAHRITESGADVLWVGLGSPKQEKILHQLMRQCELPCGAAIGAVFDFYTGRIPHAPAWVRRVGLQWAHRLLLEPKRLWKRTLISNPKFLWLVLRQLRLTRQIKD